MGLCGVLPARQAEGRLPDDPAIGACNERLQRGTEVVNGQQVAQYVWTLDETVPVVFIDRHGEVEELFDLV